MTIAIIDSFGRLGTNLPNVVVDQLTINPNGALVAATHGGGYGQSRPLTRARPY